MRESKVQKRAKLKGLAHDLLSCLASLEANNQNSFGSDTATANQMTEEPEGSSMGRRVDQLSKSTAKKEDSRSDAVTKASSRWELPSISRDMTGIPGELAITPDSSGPLPVWPWGIGTQWFDQSGAQVGAGIRRGLMGQEAHQGIIPSNWWPPYQTLPIPNH